MSGVVWEESPADLRLISLGAGVQSTALLLMGLEGRFGAAPDGAIFADTGWEPEAVYRQLDWIEATVAGRIPIYRVSYGNIRQDVLDSIGDEGESVRNPPFWVNGSDGRYSPLRRKCTSAYKIEPIDQKVRELLSVAKGRRVKGVTVEKWLGISTDEASRIKPSGRHYIANRYPLIERGLSRRDCLEWMREKGYPEPPKSACLGCPYRNDEMWAAMKRERPDEFEDACEIDDAIRAGINGTAKPGVYIHRSLKPLREVEFKVKEPLPLLAFIEECEGLCNV